ncbi:hypothetical protein [Peribacillus butanolivorans]
MVEKILLSIAMIVFASFYRFLYIKKNCLKDSSDLQLTHPLVH